MKKLFLLFVFVSAFAFAQNGRIYLPMLKNQAVDSVTKTYANWQIDTVVWQRDPAVTAISFSAHWKDSVRLSNDSACWILRLVDKTLLTRTATDTLNWSATISTTDGNSITSSWTNGKVLIGTPTYSPYADQIAFVVKYRNANGTSTPYVNYMVQKVFAK